MTLFYDKNNRWEIIAPNLICLLTDMIRSETEKDYLTLRETSRLLYSISQSVVGWSESDYKHFIGSLKDETMSYYRTNLQSSKGKSFMITRENTNIMKNDMEFLLKLFSTILPLMVLDRKKKLFFK